MPDGGASGARGAEKRNLTVLFTDLVGSTELANRMDEEALYKLFVDYEETVARRVRPFGGFVERVIGDGVLIYFGWPKARADAPEGAVRAAWAVHEGLRELSAKHGIELRCRAAVTTGQVVVRGGRSGDAMSAVYGRAPHLASRLQALAQPEGVVVAAETQALVEKSFRFKALEPAELDGFDEPVGSYEVLGVRDRALRYVAPNSRVFLGRRSELASLRSAWAAAQRGKGSSILLTGEAGIGKSALLHRQRRDVVGEDGQIILYQCSSFHRGTAYYPLINQLRRFAGLTADQSAEEQERRVRDVFGAGLGGRT